MAAQRDAIEKATTDLRRGRWGVRWFQLENGGQEAVPRSSRRGARPKRLQYDDMDSEDSVELSDIAEGEEDEQEEGKRPGQELAQSPSQGGGYDSNAVEISESDDEAPSQFSTPLKTAYSRRASSTGRSGTTSPNSFYALTFLPPGNSCIQQKHYGMACWSGPQSVQTSPIQAVMRWLIKPTCIKMQQGGMACWDTTLYMWTSWTCVG